MSCILRGIGYCIYSCCYRPCCKEDSRTVSEIKEQEIEKKLSKFNKRPSLPEQKNRWDLPMTIVVNPLKAGEDEKSKPVITASNPDNIKVPIGRMQF